MASKFLNDLSKKQNKYQKNGYHRNQDMTPARNVQEDLAYGDSVYKSRINYLAELNKAAEENRAKTIEQAKLKSVKIDQDELKKFFGQSIRNRSVENYVANRVNESYKPTIKEQIKNANRNSMSSGSFGKILTPALKSTGNPTDKDPNKLYRTDDMSEETRKAYRSAALKDKRNPMAKDAAYGDYMTDAEKDRYNEIYGVYGAEQAEEYRNLILDDINKRKATRDYYSELKGTNPIAKTAYQFGAGVASGLRGVADSGAAFMGLENTHAKSVRDYKMELIRSDQDNGAIANTAYDIASSTGYMLPGMVTGAVLGGGVGNAVFALAQYGNTYRDDLHEGRNASGSQLHAMQQGIDETATNWLLGGIGAFGGGRLKELVAKTPVGTAVKDAIGKLTNNPTTRNLLLNAADAIADMGNEAAQEYTQYYTNAITENILFYADNDLSLTNSEAWYSALLGGLNALVLNLPGNVAKSADIVREGRVAANAPAGAEAQSASKAAGGTTSAETPNAANVFAGNAEKSGITGANTQKHGASAPSQTAAAMNQGTGTADNPGNTIAEAEAQQPTNRTEDTAQPARNSSEEYTEQTAHETNNEQQAAADTTETGAQTAEGSDIPNSEQTAQNTETEQPKAADTSRVADENQVKENKEGFREYSTENSAGLYSTSSTDHMVNAYDGRTDMDRYLDAYKRVYSAGFNGIDAQTMDRAPSNIYLTTDQKLKAYEDGMRDSNLYRNRKMIYEKGEARTGGLTEGSELVGEGERKFLDWAGEKTGIKIKIEEGFKGVASIDLDKGVMRINPYAENFVASASHEFTHMIKQFSPKEYDALQRMTVEALMKSKNVSYEELYKKYEDQYRSQVNDEYTMEDILEEITADGATAYLNDAKFAENVAKQNSSLAKKIADFFRDIADVLKQIINDRGVRSVGRVMRENAARYRTAANTWYQALEKSGNMYREGYSAKTDSGERKQIDPEFEEKFDEWKKNKRSGVRFHFGTTSEALQSIGVEAKDIYMDSGKMLKILNKHHEINENVLRQLPNILEKPIIILDSATSKHVLTMFGDITGVNEENIMVALELTPINLITGEREDYQVALSAYTRRNLQNYINNRKIYYIDPNKKRTDKWLALNGLQLPVGTTRYGSIGKIPSFGEKVNAKNKTNEPYSPQDIKNAKELLDIADGSKVASKEEVKQAKVKLVLFSHNKDAAEQLGISDAEYNKRLMNWAMYPESARKLSLEINEGAPIENRWSGLENSSILTAPTAVSESELANLTGEIKGDTTGKERNYITRVMLAADTHINYRGLNFEFTDTPDPSRPRVHGKYNPATNTIRVQHNAKNAVAHEMGHYIDALWAAELTGKDKPNGQLLSEGIDVVDSYLDTKLKYGAKYADAADNFINHYDDFIDRLQQEADKRSDYMQRKSEVFARLFSEFVKWTESKPWDMGYQPDYKTQDAFTEEHFKEFAHILQEKSALDSMKEKNTDKTKFQLSDPIEETKNLIAVRNVDQSALSSMLELEGMPSPSIAVTKADIGHTQFGDVTFIFGKDTIDPQYDSRNMVFDADAWTPTYDNVQVDTDIKEDKLYPMYRKLLDYSGKYSRDNMFNDIMLDRTNFSDYFRKSSGDIVKLADESYDLKLLFLDDIGDTYGEFPTETKTKPYIEGLSNDEVAVLATKLDDIVKNSPPAPSVQRLKYINANLNEIFKAYKDATGKALYSENDLAAAKRHKASSVLFGIKQYNNGESTSETIIDTETAKKEIDDAVDENKYHKWIKDNLGEAIGKKGIRNDKDAYTRNGDLRTFRQLHDSYTAENMLKAMWRGKEQGIAGNVAISTAKNIRGASARKFNNISEMHAAADRLQNISEGALFGEKEKVLLEDANNRLNAIYSEVARNNGTGMSADVSKLTAFDANYSEAIISAAINAEDSNEVKKSFKNEKLKITDSEALKLINIFKELRNLPTDYFEAKPKRVVDWSEIKLAVVPDNIDTRLIDQLQDRGVRKIETYPAGDNAARLEAENKATDLRFQLNIDDDDPAWNHYENIVRSSSPELQTATDTLGELLSAVDYMPSDKAIERTAKKLKKYTATDTSVDEIGTELKSLFSYIAYSNNINGSDISDIAADYAGRLIENNVKAEVDPAEARAYREFRNALKGYTFHMPEGYVGEVDTLGGLQKLRRMAPGVLNITKDKGVSIDTMYQDLAERYPGMFDPDVYNPGDQLDYIVDKLSTLKPKPKVSYANEKDFDAYRYYAGQEIFKAYIAEGAAEAASKAEYRKLKQQYNKELKANAKTEKEMAALQSKAAEMQARYIEQLNISRKKVDRQTSQNRVYEARKSIKTRYWKDQILKDARELSTWMLKPTDAKHVPEALKVPLANFLNELDLTSGTPAADGGPTQRTVYWMELKDAWANIAKNGGMAEGENSVQYMYVDEDILEKMSELTDRIKGIKKLEDLDYIDVLKLSDVVKGMKHAIENANKMITLNRSVDAVSRGTLNHLQKLKTKTKRAGLFGVPSDVMYNRMLDAGTRFHTFGRDAEAVYQEIRKGFNRKVQHTAEAAQMFSDLKEKTGFTDKEINDWKYRKAYDVKVSSGETIHISTGQAMNLYNLMKREQAREHVLRGGITLTSVKLNGKSLTGKLTESENIHVNQSDVLNIIGQLTPKEKMFADGLAEIMQKMSDWGNETSMQLMGYKKFRDSHYWPIKSSKDYISNTLDQAAMGGLDKTSVKNAGPTKSTVKHANNPILVGDAIDVWSEHVNFMANYNAFAASLTDLNKWYNYIDIGDIRNPDEVKYKGSVKQEIKRAFGSEANDFIMRFIEDVNGSGERDTSPFNAAISLFKGSAVGANLSVAIQQPTAIFRAVAVMDPEFLAKGLTHKSTADWDTIKKYSAIAQWKDWGFYETDTGKSMKSILTGQDTWLEKLNEKQMWLAGKGDEITWKCIWAAAEQQVMTQQPKLEVGSEAFYKAAAEVFDNVIDQTQVVDSVFTKSDLMRSKNALNKMNTAFFAEPTKSYDMLYRALYDWRKADSPEVKKAAAKQLARSLMAFILSNAASAAAKSVVMAMRDKGEDRDKAFWERWWAHFGPEFFSNIFLPNYIVWVKDAMSLLAGYDIERPDLQGVADIGYVVQRWISYYKGESRYTFGNNMLYTTKAFGSTTGIGFYAAQRDINALIDTMFEAMGLDAAAYEKDKLLGYDIGSSKNTKYYLSKAIAAYRKDQKGLGDQIIGDMLKAGIPEDEIDTKEKNLLKDDPKFSGLLDATISGDTDTADKAKQELVRDGYKEEIVNKAVENSVGNYAEDNGYTYVGLNDTLNSITNYKKEGFKDFNDKYKEWERLQNIKNGWDSEKCKKEFRSNCTKYFKPLYKEGDSAERSRILNILSRVKTTEGEAIYPSDSDILAWGKE